MASCACLAGLGLSRYRHQLIWCIAVASHDMQSVCAGSGHQPTTHSCSASVTSLGSGGTVSFSSRVRASGAQSGGRSQAGAAAAGWGVGPGAPGTHKRQADGGVRRVGWWAGKQCSVQSGGPAHKGAAPCTGREMPL